MAKKKKRKLKRAFETLGKEFKVKTRTKTKKRKAKKRTQVRARAISRLFGIPVTEERGRPKGTYKYGMPIHEYKKLLARERALAEQFREQQKLELIRKGIPPGRAEQLQLLKAVEEKKGVPIGVLETPETVMRTADDELQFRKWKADKTISYNTQKLLRNLRRVQLKADADNIEMQRKLKERRMISKAGNILSTPYILNKHKLDFTGVKEDNILLAPNIFREIPENHILRPRRLNILQTKETGNNLSF